MIIRENVPLAPITTFGVEATAAWHISLESLEDVSLWNKETKNDPRFNQLPFMPLGAGSNVLFTKDFDGAILSINLFGQEILSRSGTSVLLRIGAGEQWHKTVQRCVNNNLFGIENLALIPGNVGAAPIQNIGAYGMEIEKRISSVEYYDLSRHTFTTINRSGCKFGYRTSIFKTELKSRCIITAVTLELSEIPDPISNYGDVKQELAALGIRNAEPKDIFDTVISIRKRKLPDPKVLGNAGSFFKNPVIPLQQAITLQTLFPDMPQYTLQNEFVKIPAAWLIDKAGWKGFRRGNIGVSPIQALVIVNYGGAKGVEIAELAIEISKSVKHKFGIILETEVNIIGDIL